MIIEEKFAQYYNFDNSNSITYSSNQFGDALVKAIEMSDSEYQNLQYNLETLSNSLYKKSLENLEKLLVRIG
jgi:hypothetical protein